MAWLSGLQPDPPPELVRAGGWTDLKDFDFVAIAREQDRLAGGKVDQDSTVLVPRRTWSRIDFSGANFADVLFEQAVVEDCVFDRADLSGSRWAGCEVSRSMFRNADLRGAHLSIRWKWKKRPSRWSACDFDGSRYSGDGLSYTEFVNCQLSFRTWKDVYFTNCRFEECSFAGRMVRVHFNSLDIHVKALRPRWRREPLFPVTFVRPDFSRAAILDVEFLGCTFADPVWPEKSAVLEVPRYAQVFDYINRELADDDSSGMRTFTWLNQRFSSIRPREESPFILDLGMFAEEPRDALDSYLHLFERAARALELPPPVVHGARR